MADDGMRVGGKRVYVRWADTIERKPVDWLWFGRIPYGMISIIDGNPNLGKGFVTFWLAASVSIGRVLPGDTRPRKPANVLVLSSEDSEERTIAPRLYAAGADLKRVLVNPVIGDEGEYDKRPFCFPDDFDAVRDLIIKHHFVLLLVDPIMAYLSEKIDSASDQSVRRVMHLLKDLAEETGCAVLLVRHFNKNAGAAAIHRGGGSIGLIGAARVGMMVEEFPDDKDRRVLAVTKNNLAKPPAALVYEIVSSHEHPDIGLVRWHGETTYTADDLVSPSARAESTKFGQAVAFLRTALPEGIWRVGSVVEEEAAAAGISPWTLKRARHHLRVEPEKRGFGKDGKTWWRRPAAPVREDPEVDPVWEDPDSADDFHTGAQDR